MTTLENIMNLVKFAEPVLTLVAVLAALASGISAWRSYRLARELRFELKSDETLVAGVLAHPGLSHSDHENCVLQTTVFNKSKRKCVVSNVQVFGARGSEILVDWAASISSLGEPLDRSQLIGVVDGATLYVRRRDGLAFTTASVHITHSFSTMPLVLGYEMAPDWQQYFAKTN
jgi:hypothetical protein